MKPRVTIAVPNLGHIDTRLVMKLLRWTAMPQNWEQATIIMPIGHIPHDSARNHCVDQFLQTGDTHLLFLDDDVIPPPDALQQLLEADKDVISGIYPSMYYDGRKMEMMKRNNVFSGIREDGELIEAKGKGVQKIAYAGGGCLLIRRHVVEQLVSAPYFAFEYNDVGIMTLGEDIYFGNKLKAADVDLFAHFDVQCNHVKYTIL